MPRGRRKQGGMCCTFFFLAFFAFLHIFWQMQIFRIFMHISAHFFFALDRAHTPCRKLFFFWGLDDLDFTVLFYKKETASLLNE